MFLFRKKITFEEFIVVLVDQIIKSENNVNFTNSKFLTAEDIERLREYIPVFRLHLLLLYLTTHSKNIFDVTKIFSLIFESIEKNGRSIGWDDKTIKQVSDAVFDMQNNYESRIGKETNHSDKLFFHSCRYFSDYLFPKETSNQDKNIDSYLLAVAVYKNLNNLFKGYKVVLN